METETSATNLRVASFSCYLDTAKSAMVKASVNNHISQSPRVASFSHYLDSTEENFAFKASAGGVQLAGARNMEKPKTKDGELDIFGADRYFNMKMEDETQPKAQEYYIDESGDLTRQKSRLEPRTPSVYSEASSWNSQTAFLRNLQRNASQGKQKKALGRRFLGSFSCHGPCLDKKSIFVSRSIDPGLVYGTKNTQQVSRTEDHISTRALNPNKENLTVKMKTEAEKIDDPRVSLEVFGYKAKKKEAIIPANLERKVSTLTWDAIPISKSATTINSSTVCDDMASDASSDLFEIENISGSGYGLLTTTQETDDTMSSCMSPTTQYAPSEASIQWSVVTASAADFSSMVSDYEERSVSVAGDFVSVSRIHRETTKAKNDVRGGVHKSRTGGLLGCKNQTAIDVAVAHVHQASDKAKHQGVDSYVSLGKLQASAKVKDVQSIRLPPKLLD